MKNFEKYEKDIREVGYDFAVVNETEKPVSCSAMYCELCKFNSGVCVTNRIEWLYSEYTPRIDWSKVKVDTVIRVRQNESHEWKKRHFARYAFGKVFAWSDGRSSATVDTEADMTSWNFAELVEEKKIDGRTN